VIVALVVVGALAGAVGALWLWGWTRPAGHVATVSRTVAAPPERVWATILDHDRHAEWRSAVKQVRRTGARIEETDRRGDVLAMVVEVEEAPRRLVTRIVDQSMFGGTWTCTLEPDGDGTRVQIVERGEIHSAFFRALAPLFHDPEATARTWLEDLAKRLA
jgi:uncharacterized protein YndB with AHSA1/START domain